MSNAVEIKNLGKKYIISHDAKMPYKTFKETLVTAANPLNWGKKSQKEEFWALKDINLEFNAGDKIGIIGRNGAGKSTLLKLLSRITEPTTGKIIINGRVASLLEVGTGFHQELSGRENIFLNGAILGMSKAEIKRKFDEIVEFSGVEQFLDTPVKRYSSGMRVRLGFAVAAHLESEILIVDEVLAVGDAEFQKKCLGKMSEVSQKEGRTVLFVSHNMGVIRQLCNKGVFLDKGQVDFSGDVSEAVSRYLDLGGNSAVYKYNNGVDFVRIVNEADFANWDGQGDKEFVIEFDNKTGKEIKNVSFNFTIMNEKSIRVCHLWSEYLGQKYNLKKGSNLIKVSLKNMNLFAGNYYLDLHLFNNKLNIEHIMLAYQAFAFEAKLKTYPKSKVALNNQAEPIIIPEFMMEHV